MSERPPSVLLTKLYRKQSKTGSTYFVGRLAAARVVLVKSKDLADEGAEIWQLLLSEATKSDASQRDEEARRDWQKPASNAPAEVGGFKLQRQFSGDAPLDDAIPF